MTYDSYHRFKVVRLLDPQLIQGTSAVTGQSVDLRGYESFSGSLATGAIADLVAVAKLQESDDNSSWSDVASEDLLGDGLSNGIGTNDDNKVVRFAYRGHKRYVRVHVKPSAAGGSAVNHLAGIGICGRGRKLPIGSQKF